MLCKFIYLFSYVEVRSQGPAVTLKITRDGREYSVDLTLAIKDNTWPEDAEEWSTRRRNGTVSLASKGWFSLTMELWSDM